ncbi:MAG: hypothetical protein M3Y33_17650 [Actinomycetota bacterium]|nr:hypothetical protein [Actinomycetota bacterium]
MSCYAIRAGWRYWRACDRWGNALREWHGRGARAKARRYARGYNGGAR